MNYLRKKSKTPLFQLVTEVPKSYKNNSLFSNLTVGITNNLFVKVLETKIIGINFYMKFQNLISGENFSGTYFRFHYGVPKIFTIGKELYIKGKISWSEDWGFQIANPVEIKKPNDTVEPVYKSKAIEKVVLKYIDYGNFKKYGVPYWVIEKILEIHRYPTRELAEFYEKEKTFPEDYIKALKYLEIFYYIKNMKEAEKTFPPLQKLSGDWKSWAETLPFQLTGDQKKSISDIAIDLNSDTAKKRVIVGDVGSGKTLVILASMVISYPHKSVLLAPTSILSEQLFEEAQKFLPKNFKILLLTSKTSQKIDLNEFDVIIGTTAILYRDLPEIPLLIVDEQHRFGTRERNKLKQLVENEEKKPHFLQLSATPIPRTQAMINSTFIEVSLIEEIPFQKKIDTNLIGAGDFPNLLEKIKNEIEKENQVLLVYPLVEESEKINYQSLEEAFPYWKENFENVYMTHGRDSEKDEVLREFREKGDILLSTTVVEVGISLPRLTVIVIVGAERLGLATLHQLRGRVSRTGKESFCYLFTRSQSEESIKRLEKFSKTTNGFDIASMDLENRKGGDIVKGNKQSGETFRWIDLVKDKEFIEDFSSQFK
ncbi:RecG-like helicase [Thiovulum sp. ES]|nr:RecG-like helicase [Thiovulum sp. ES]